MSNRGGQGGGVGDYLPLIGKLLKVKVTLLSYLKNAAIGLMASTPYTFTVEDPNYGMNEPDGPAGYHTASQ